MMAGIDMVHVPYRGGGPAITDLIAGQVQVYFASTPASIEYVKAGRLRALAVTTAARSKALPDIPTVAEFVPGYEASYWVGTRPLIGWSRLMDACGSIDFCHDFQPIVSPSATGARNCQCFRHASSSGLQRQRCRRLPAHSFWLSRPGTRGRKA